jgi:FkbM family methyltransferase
VLTLLQAADTATDLACRMAGRRNVVRAARLVLRRASRDIPNDMTRNGETNLQRWVLAAQAGGRDVHVIDAGANVGRWSASMLDAARRNGRSGNLCLHCFEPASWTFARLSAALGDNGRVSLQQAALSDRSGMSALNVFGDGAGRNSLHRSLGSAAAATEEITVITLDEYADRSGLSEIALLKVDTEGHDLAVLRGARKLITDRRIAVIQFEYNWRWIEARSYLSDAFSLLGPAGYRLGKLTPRGIETYPGWDPDLETFVEGNYVAALPEAAAGLPTVRWWKLESGGYPCE